MKWVLTIIGRWKANHYRTKRADYLFRTYDDNEATLENGGTLWDH